jgi:hypothetical protein
MKLVGGLALVLAGTVAQAATLKTAAAPTLFLESTGGAGEVGLAYDPIAGLYYSGTAGSPSRTGRTWDSSGVLQSATTLGIDIRSVWYNPNTGTVEASTYAAYAGSADRGLMTVNTGSNGEWGGSGTKQTTISGIASDQSGADYDAGRNVLYSRNSGSTVNVIDHTTGTLQGTVALAGLLSGTVMYTVGYIDSLDALVTLSYASNTAQVFDATTGGLLGNVTLSGLSGEATDYGMAYENGYLFVNNGDFRWAGFDITDGDDAAAVPLPAGLPLLLAGLGALGLVRRRRD